MIDLMQANKKFEATKTILSYTLTFLLFEKFIFSLNTGLKLHIIAFKHHTLSDSLSLKNIISSEKYYISKTKHGKIMKDNCPKS